MIVAVFAEPEPDRTVASLVFAEQLANGDIYSRSSPLALLTNMGQNP